MKIIQIIPAPPSSSIVTGPTDKGDPNSVYIDPCSCIALMEDELGNRTLAPCGFSEYFEPFTDHNPELFAHRQDADREVTRRIEKAGRELDLGKAIKEVEAESKDQVI